MMLCLLLCGSATMKAQVEGMPMKAAHEVRSGETLYSISKKYNVSVENIRKVNPRIGDTLLAGSIVFIPDVEGSGLQDAESVQPTVDQIPRTDGPGMVKPNTPCKTMYEVGKKETIFSIARQFHISEEDLLRANPQITDYKIKKGEFLCIPYTQNELYEMRREGQQYAESQRARAAEEAREAAEAARRAKMLERIRVAVILPFSLDAAKKSKEAVKMYDFYEGFLLAIDELKAQGANVDVYAFEEPTALSGGMELLLTNPDLEKANLIVGPMRLENLPSLSRFASQRHIPLAVPFSTKASITAGVPVCYQINTTADHMYQQIFSQVIDRYQHHNIIIVNVGDRGEKTDYINQLKLQLEQHALSYKTIAVADLATLSELTIEGMRTLIVPTSNTQNAYEKVVAKLDQASGLDISSIDLFGYPEWQTFSDKNKQSMRKYHAAFFCTFYTDPTSAQVLDFNQKFRFWFKRDQMGTYPQYGLLGYDTAKFFVSGLQQHGLDFMDNSTSLRIPALQNPMMFEKQAGNGGFVNTYFRIVSF